MARLANQAQFDPGIRELTERIIKNVFPHDYMSEYVAVLNWIRTNIRYTRDPISIEQVKTPQIVVETASADCDEMSTLAASMISIIGGKTRFVAASFDASKPPSHVWCEAYEPNSKVWVIIDPVPGRKVGQMVGRIKKTMIMAGVQ